VQTYGLKLGAEARAYADRLLELPAMRDWYEAGLRETVREEGHENESRVVGTWTADLRATA
jgi:glutathione S-transferase